MMNDYLPDKGWSNWWTDKGKSVGSDIMIPGIIILLYDCRMYYLNYYFYVVSTRLTNDLDRNLTHS